MVEWIIFVAAVLVPSFIIAFGPVLIDMAEEIVPRSRNRRPRPVSDDDWNDQNPPKSLNYNYIDWLERELQVGKYDPDRIALGFDDTEPEPKPLDPEVDALPMPDAVEADEGCPCAACRSKRRAETSEELVDRLLAELNEAKPKPKPVDDSWADVDVRDGAYGSETRGLLRRIVDSRGNWTEIRSFGS